MNKINQPWIYSAWTDSAFILFPPILSLLLIFLFQETFETSEVTIPYWIVLILLIDVAHVYSTLYRTYFDKETFEKHKSLLVYIPFVAWTLGVILYEIDAVLFWRILAYLAVFHFIRQQYGFMRIYSRKDRKGKISSFIDSIAIYYAALYPVLFWHMHAPRNFHWFMEGDFLYFKSFWISFLSSSLYWLVIAVYVVKELFEIYRNKTFNIPKNSIIATTFLSWYFGIVYFNGDLIFTTLNVVSHGIPYMALIWIYGKKKYFSLSTTSLPQQQTKFLFTGYGIAVFLLIVFLLAYFEEGLWDGLVWKERTEVFPIFAMLPVISDKDLLAFLIPLLSIPQISHYLIDGFIWKISKDKSGWEEAIHEKHV